MNLEALKMLAEKVESGEFYHDLTGEPDDLTSAQIESYFGSVFQQDHWAWQAYLGSLDAARDLHSVVLPGCTWEIGPYGADVILREKYGEEPVGSSRFPHGNNPARAWLLAILRALIAQEESNG